MYAYPLDPVVYIDPLGLLSSTIHDVWGVSGAVIPEYGPAGFHRVRAIANKANLYSENMAGIVGGSWNGHADALRHCYLMCELAKEFSPEIAKKIGDNHEQSENKGIVGQQRREMIMDLKNNAVGISCASSDNDCGYSCMEKYSFGELYDLDGLIDNPKLITGGIVPDA